MKRRKPTKQQQSIPRNDLFYPKVALQFKVTHCTPRRNSKRYRTSTHTNYYNTNATQYYIHHVCVRVAGESGTRRYTRAATRCLQRDLAGVPTAPLYLVYIDYTTRQCVRNPSVLTSQ